MPALKNKVENSLYKSIALVIGINSDTYFGKVNN